MPAKRRTSTAARRASAAPRETPNFFDRLEWRSAGPYRGGRVGAVAGDPRDRNTFYFGSTGGGGGEKMEGGRHLGETTHKGFNSGAPRAVPGAPGGPHVIYLGAG